MTIINRAASSLVIVRRRYSGAVLQTLSGRIFGFLFILLRRASVLRLEATTEIGRRVESAAVAHFGHRHFGVLPNHGGGVFQPTIQQEVVRCHSGESLELFIEQRAAHAYLLTQLNDVEVRIVYVLFDGVCHLLQQFLVHRVDAREVYLRQGLFLKLMLHEQAVSYQVVGAGQQQLRVEGFGHVVVRPAVQAFDVLFGRVEGREQDDGDVARVDVVLDLQAHLRAAHFGHHDVADDEVGSGPAHLVQPLVSVACQHRVVEGREELSQHLQQFLVVLHQQQRVGFPVFGFGIRQEGHGNIGHGRFVVPLRFVGRVFQPHVRIAFEDAFAARQADGECASAAHGASDADASVVFFHDASGQCQPDARPAEQVSFPFVVRAAVEA